MQSRLVEAPTVEPFTLDEVKQALRVTHDLQDDYIWSLARSARKMCEDAARIAISPQRWRAVYRAPERHGDEFGLTNGIADPERILNRIVLPRPPAVAITAAEIVHRHTGEHVALTEGVEFIYDPHFATLTWTAIGQRVVVDPWYTLIEIEFACGYPFLNPGATPITPDRTVRQVAVDDAIREAIFITTANGYDDPAGVASTVPARALMLLRPYWNTNRVFG